MLTHPLIAFDIETIPDPDFGRLVMGFEGDTAAVAELDPDTGRFEFHTFGGKAGDEKSHHEEGIRRVSAEEGFQGRREVQQRKSSANQLLAFR